MRSADEVEEDPEDPEPDISIAERFAQMGWREWFVYFFYQTLWCFWMTLIPSWSPDPVMTGAQKPPEKPKSGAEEKEKED